MLRTKRTDPSLGTFVPRHRTEVFLIGGGSLFLGRRPDDSRPGSGITLRRKVAVLVSARLGENSSHNSVAVRRFRTVVTVKGRCRCRCNRTGDWISFEDGILSSKCQNSLGTMRPFLALAVLLGLAGGAVGMATRYLPRQSTLGPSFRERQFQRLQPLEQSVIPPIVINPYYRPTLKDYATLCFKRYLNLSEERPFLTKGVTAAVVGGVGDVLSQSIVASAARVRFQWDVIRTLTFMMIGLCFKGPAMHVWFRALGRFGHWMEERTGFSDMKQSLVVLAIDQTIGVAILYPLFYVMYEVFSSVLSFRGE